MQKCWEYKLYPSLSGFMMKISKSVARFLGFVPCLIVRILQNTSFADTRGILWWNSRHTWLSPSIDRHITSCIGYYSIPCTPYREDGTISDRNHLLITSQRDLIRLLTDNHQPYETPRWMSIWNGCNTITTFDRRWCDWISKRTNYPSRKAPCHTQHWWNSRFSFATIYCPHMKRMPRKNAITMRRY